MGAGPFVEGIFVRDLLAGQAAVVTGGGSGIGRAIARALAGAGADLVIAARRAERLEAAAAEIASGSGRRCLAVPTDIREPEQAGRLVERTLAEYGRLDIVVNNAGGQFAAPAEDYSVKGWNAVINTNLSGTWHVIQAAGRAMIPRGGGVIINITAAFWRGMPGIAHSSAARAAVTNLTRSLAVEWARHGIRINCVAPGPVATPGFERAYGAEVREMVLREVPLGRFGRPEEVAAAVVFLASPAGRYVTGTSLCIDGGAHFWGDLWGIPPPGSATGKAGA